MSSESRSAVTLEGETTKKSEALVKEILTLFLRAETVVRSTRITRQGEVVQHVEDIAAGIEGAMRNFKHDHDSVKAATVVTQLQNLLTSRYKEWEVETKRLQKTRVEVRNTPSGDQLRKMAAEKSAVQTAVNSAQVKIRALITALSQFNSTPSDSPAVDCANGNSSLLDELQPVERLLFRLIDGRLELQGEQAKKVGFAARERELVIDKKLRLLLIVRWGVWGHDQLELRFWIVPKDAQVCAALLDETRRVSRLAVSAGEQVHSLRFEAAEGGDCLPQQDEIREFLLKIKDRRFANADVPFQYLLSQLRLETSFSDGVLRNTFGLQIV